MPLTPFNTGANNFPVGSLILSIGPTGSNTAGSVSYIATDINPLRPTKEIEQHDQIGNWASSQFEPERATLDCTLQITSASMSLPLQGYSFLCPAGDQALMAQNVSNMIFSIYEVGPKLAQGAAWTVAIKSKSTTLASG